MSGLQSIVIDTWAKVDGQSRIVRDVDQFEVQFEIGERQACLLLVCTADGLANLMTEAAVALEELRLKRQPGSEHPAAAAPRSVPTVSPRAACPRST